MDLIQAPSEDGIFLSPKYKYQITCRPLGSEFGILGVFVR